MMAELVMVTGRPMVHDPRATLDAINYVTRYGIEWRALPVDFPPHEAPVTGSSMTGGPVPANLVPAATGCMAGASNLPRTRTGDLLTRC